MVVLLHKYASTWRFVPPFPCSRTCTVWTLPFCIIWLCHFWGDLRRNEVSWNLFSPLMAQQSVSLGPFIPKPSDRWTSLLNPSLPATGLCFFAVDLWQMNSIPFFTCDLQGDVPGGICFRDQPEVYAGSEVASEEEDVSPWRGSGSLMLQDHLMARVQETWGLLSFLFCFCRGLSRTFIHGWYRRLPCPLTARASRMGDKIYDQTLCAGPNSAGLTLAGLQIAQLVFAKPQNVERGHLSLKSSLICWVRLQWEKRAKLYK